MQLHNNIMFMSLILFSLVLELCVLDEIVVRMMVMLNGLTKE